MGATPAVINFTFQKYNPKGKCKKESELLKKMENKDKLRIKQRLYKKTVRNRKETF